ncbi:SCO1664 family protein [Mobilicoccus massiliensis]|uniref:SCO1664 family protein n=1 Tax=Mobilicoccus massiliensis TaxID=1522310 RepID=UPI000693F436|nr:SCO1664 family protein [Mobilicoccus massiliensis]
MTSRAAPPEDSLAELTSALDSHPLEIVGQLLDASNDAFFAWAGPVPVIYKPVRGERPLWDFPTGCLAHRERASYLIDAAGGFGVVPPTALVDGPFGEGAVQRWITDPDLLVRGGDEDATDDEGDDVEGDDEDAGDGEVEVVAEDEVDDTLFALLPPGRVAPPWLPVFSGELPDGRPVVLAHADSPELRTVAALDAVLNNSDRKGSHLLRSPEGHLWGIDHGVTLHEHPKLRTVLWGWAGDPIPEEDLARVRRVETALDSGSVRAELSDLLTGVEIDALAARVAALVADGRYPLPHPGWPPVPWPAL